MLEDDPAFNAGLGAVMSIEGTYELDASIMSGRQRWAGAVGGVRTVANPISVARRVMDAGKHVFLAGDGAEAFAEQQGFRLASDDYFFDQAAFDEIQLLRKNRGLPPLQRPSAPDGHGTVGAVARNMHGDLAAGTSSPWALRPVDLTTNGPGGLVTRRSLELAPMPRTAWWQCRRPGGARPTF